MHYEALSKPRDPSDFIADLQKRHTAALDRLNKAMRKDTTGGVRITMRRGEPWISVPPLAKQPEPANLAALKAEISSRWGVIDLLDVPKEVDRATGFTADFTSVASRTSIDPDVLRRRLLLDLYGLGTNIGIKRVADGVAAVPGLEGDIEAALRRIRRLFINRDNLRAGIRTIVNKTLAVRDTGLWGPGTSCASDSRKFGSWNANAMTEWHQRYRGPGIMVYWHVERRSVCIYSQVTATSASEVASMIEGLLRHLTDAEIDRQYTDTHGTTIVGFAFSELLGFSLMPRLKNIGSARLYRPGTDEPAPVPARRHGRFPGSWWRRAVVNGSQGRARPTTEAHGGGIVAAVPGPGQTAPNRAPLPTSRPTPHRDHTGPKPFTAPPWLLGEWLRGVRARSLRKNPLADHGDHC